MTEQNFLFGLTALRDGLINPTQFADAGREWMAVPSLSLAEILTERGWLSSEDRSTIEDRLGREVEPPTIDAPTTSPANGDGSTIVYSGSGSSFQGANAFAGGSTRDDLMDGHGAAGSGFRDESRFGARYSRVVFYAEGGIGRVYCANDTVLGRGIAIKQLKDKYLHDDRMVDRFLEEARITSRLVHPNIVPIHDLSHLAEKPFYAMKFLEGRTFKDAIHRHHRTKAQGGPPPEGLRDLLEKFIGVCNAIAFAHENGVIHRDIKGQNVILGSFGEAIVLDWGLAKQLDRKDDPLGESRPDSPHRPDCSTGGTMPGQAIGTINYIPPEQAEGRHDRIGKCSDVFGLGAMLYLILTDRPPFDDVDRDLALALARECSPPTPRSINPLAPAALEAICRKAMAKEPRDRYASVTALSDDVRRWLNDEPVSVYRDTRPARIGRWSRKNQSVVAGLGALLFTATLGLGIGAWRVGVESGRVARAKTTITENLVDSMNLIEGMLGVLVTDLPQVHAPEIDLVRLKVATTTTGFLKTLSGRNLEDPSLRFPLSNMLREAAKLQELTGHLPESEASYRRALDLLVDKKNEGTSLEHDLRAEYQIALVDVLLRQGKANDAAKAADVARATAEASRKLFPAKSDMIRTEARAMMVMADVRAMQSRLADAERLDGQAIDLFEGLARANDVGAFDALSTTLAVLNRGVALRDLGRTDDAIKALTNARDRAVAMIAKKDNVADARNFMALSQVELARTPTGKPDPAGALKAIDEAIAEIARLAEGRPLLTGFRLELAYALLTRAGMPTCPDPLADLTRARDLCDQVLTDCPAGAPTRAIRARARVGLAGLALDKKDPGRARTLLKDAEEDLAILKKVNPDDPEARETAKRLKDVALRLK